MHLDEEKIEGVQTVLVEDDTGVGFFEAEKGADEREWVVYSDKLWVHGKHTEDGDCQEGVCCKVSATKFVDGIQGRDLRARIFNALIKAQENILYFTEWNYLAQYLGVSDMVVISTKVPKIIGRRFAYFASRESSESNQLRRLIYDYVKLKMVDEAGRLMFRDDI